MCWEDIITITYGCGHVIIESPKRHYCDNPKCKYSASHSRGHDCIAHGCTQNIYENKRGWPEPHHCYECREARLRTVGTEAGAGAGTGAGTGAVLTVDPQSQPQQ